MWELVFPEAEHERIQRLPDQLGPRKMRLLVSAWCRGLFHSFLDETEPEALRSIRDAFCSALEVNDRFADTGKSKTALKGAQKSIENFCHEGTEKVVRALLSQEKPLLDTLGRGANLSHIRDQVPEELLVPLLQRYLSDMTPPRGNSGKIDASWIDPEVLELAESIYRKREFQRMPELADALERAGCRNREALAHCRSGEPPHNRGCWVLDAILADRITTAPPPKAKTRTTIPKDSLLAKLPKRAREDIADVMQNRDGSLPLVDFLAKRWDVRAHWKKGPFRSDEDIARLIEETRSHYAQAHPHCSRDQLDMAMSLELLKRDLQEVAIARRCTLEDPAELGRGLGVLNRLRNALREPEPFTDGILQVCAVRDIAIAQNLVNGLRPGCTAIPSDQHLFDIAQAAILQRDFEMLKAVIVEMEKRKRPWMQGTCMYLAGVVKGDPDRVAGGLNLNLSRLKKDRTWYGAIDLQEHGLYRLCEWISPDLVSKFDVAQSLPWDAGFHAWCQDHPDPVAGLDLRSISPVLHEIAVLGKVPEWLKPPAQQLYEIVLLGGDPKVSRVLQLVGSCAGTSGSPREAKQLLERCPVVLGWNVPLDYAENYRKELEKAGASAEVRVMDQKPFRFVL